MAGHQPWQNLVDKMSPERRARSDARLKEMKIGMLIAELREQSGMTQQEIADKLGITQPSISQMEAGQEIQLTTLRKLIGALGGEVVLHMPDRQISLENVAD